MRRILMAAAAALLISAGHPAQAANLPGLFSLPVDLPEELAQADAVDVKVRVWDPDDSAWPGHEETAHALSPGGRSQIHFRLGLRKRIHRADFSGRTVRYEVAARKAGVGEFAILKTSAPVQFIFEKPKTVVEKIRLDRWVILGLCGQVLFMMRFLIQWIVSERRRESTIPIAFWWCSIGGASIVLVYGLVQNEPIIIFGQFGIIIYLRNLYLIYSNSKRKKQEALEDSTLEK